jgi:uroporphyrinogen-III decarboxylase
MNKVNGGAYGERLKRIEDAVRLQKPDRVPVLVEFGYFIARYAGMTFRDIFYDSAKCVRAYQQTVTGLEPDAFNCIPFDAGPAMEMVDARTMKWPGHGLGPERGHQYLEGEYMMADEYDAFMENPTDFILNVYLPRTCGALDAFRNAPGLFSFMSVARGRVSPFFADPEFAAACRALYQASCAAREWNAAWRRCVEDLENRGYPAITVVGAGQAPFDFFSDHLRGMKGIMTDMYRQPDKLLAAMDKVLPLIIRRIKTLTAISGNNLAFMGPHRGAEGFMSLKQFEKFYWPGLKAAILAVIENGFTPYILWEGDYTSRLEYLLELPPGKIICRFDRTDIRKAAAVLGGHHCIAGGIYPSLLQTGSAAQVEGRCRELIESVGRDGGYIMSHSSPLDEARIENVRAMFEATREYGVYK